MSEAQISGLGHCAPTLRSRRIQSRAVEVTEQTVQHLSHFYGLAREGVESTCCDHPSVSRDDQVVLQFRGRVEREAHETCEFSSALLAVALDDVGRNRHGRPNHLTAQRYELRASYSHRCAMHIQCECMTLPPNLEILEIAHASQRRQRSEMATSFRLEHNPTRREVYQDPATSRVRAQ